MRRIKIYSLDINSISELSWISHFISIHQLISKVKFILSSISSGWIFWSVNYTSIYENAEWMLLKNINFDGKSNCPNGLLEEMCTTFLICVLTRFHWTSIASVISSNDMFSPFLSLAILLAVLSSNYIDLGVDMANWKIRSAILFFCVENSRPKIPLLLRNHCINVVYFDLSLLCVVIRFTLNLWFTVNRSAIILN